MCVVLRVELVCVGSSVRIPLGAFSGTEVGAFSWYRAYSSVSQKEGPKRGVRAAAGSFRGTCVLCYAVQDTRH